MLSSLTFPEDVEKDYDVFRQNTVRVVDICFDRGAANDESGYKGGGDCPIISLGRFYMMITSGGNSGAMEDESYKSRVTRIMMIIDSQINNMNCTINIRKSVGSQG